MTTLHPTETSPKRYNLTHHHDLTLSILHIIFTVDQPGAHRPLTACWRHPERSGAPDGHRPTQLLLQRQGRAQLHRCSSGLLSSRLVGAKPAGCGCHTGVHQGLHLCNTAAVLAAVDLSASRLCSTAVCASCAPQLRACTLPWFALPLCVHARPPVPLPRPPCSAWRSGAW